MEKEELKPGKRYWFPLNNYNNVKMSGLFTGEFDKNGNAIMATKVNELWSIPPKDLKEKMR